jgi:hypothetical protein
VGPFRRSRSAGAAWSTRPQCRPADASAAGARGARPGGPRTSSRHTRTRVRERVCGGGNAGDNTTLHRHRSKPRWFAAASTVCKSICHHGTGSAPRTSQETGYARRLHVVQRQCTRIAEPEMRVILVAFAHADGTLTPPSRASSATSPTSRPPRRRAVRRRSRLPAAPGAAWRVFSTTRSLSIDHEVRTDFTERSVAVGESAGSTAS